MKTLVQKFGGSSLKNDQLREKAAQHVIVAREMGYAPVVVVSAIGRSGDPYATDTLINELKKVNVQASSRNQDLLLSCGETISAVIFAEVLNKLGHTALALTGWQSGILTDDCFGNSHIVSINPSHVLNVIEQGIIPVVTGYQGVTPHQDVTTLGRGGSDTTAVALGAVLHSEWVEIYTDVDGVKTADPKVIPDAPTITRLTYQEIKEMAHLGAKVIHPRAVEIAMEENLLLKILSTTIAGAGTVISKGVGVVSGGERVADRVVTGIAYLGKRSHVRISGVENFNESALALRIFSLLAENGVSVDLIYLSLDLIAFIIDDEMTDTAKEVLSELELNIGVETGFAKVSVVGAGMHGVPGVMARVVRSLEKAKVPTFQTTYSHANISCLTRDQNLTEAIRALFGEFQLSNEEGS